MSQAIITSRDNKLFRQWVSLQTAKGIERHGLALVSGRKIVPELLAEMGGKGATLVTREGDSSHPPSLWEGARGRDAAVEQSPAPQAPTPTLPQRGRGQEAQMVRLSRALFAELDEFGTGAPLLVVPVPRIDPYTEERKPIGLALAVAAQDPGNLGAILRCALAFEASQVLLLRESAHPFLPRVTRAASGANFQVPLLHGPSVGEIPDDWIALDTEGEPIDGFEFSKDCRLLLGEEGLGIPDGFAGRRLKIPISRRAESLNVAVAAGVALAAYRRRHPL